MIFCEEGREEEVVGVLVIIDNIWCVEAGAGSCLMVVVSHGNLLLSPTTHLQPSNRGLSPGSPSVPGRTPGLAHHHQSDNTDMNTPSDNQNLLPECDL